MSKEGFNFGRYFHIFDILDTLHGLGYDVIRSNEKGKASNEVGAIFRDPFDSEDKRGTTYSQVVERHGERLHILGFEANSKGEKGDYARKELERIEQGIEKRLGY